MNTPKALLGRSLRNTGLTAAGLLAVALTCGTPAQAQSPGTTLASILARLKADEDTISKQQATISNLQSQVKNDEKREQGDIQNVQTREQNDIVGVKDQLTSDESHISSLQTKTAAIRVSNDPNAGGTNTLLTFTGVNVQIVNGLGATNGEPNAPNDTDNPVVNGLGNLIVGYDEVSQSYHTARGGSHNIVVGTGNNYSSIGGLVAGTTNAVAAPFASVTGGQNNLASGVASSISGGNLNVADGTNTSVTGGFSNKASGFQATVTGGRKNIAVGDYSTVSGGENNTAGGQGGAVSGGIANHANSQDGSVSGGFHNAADGVNASVTGGLFNAASGDNSAVSGGSGVIAASSYEPVTDSHGNIVGAKYVPSSTNPFTWVGAGLASH